MTRQQPTATLMIEGDDSALRLAQFLLMKKQTFTMEPSPHTPGRWYVGLLPAGEALMRDAYGLVEAGTLGDVEPNLGQE